MDRLIALGRFGAPQGVRGEIRVKSYTADPKAIDGYGPLTDEARLREFVLKVVRGLRDDVVVVRVQGLSTRDHAEALNGIELYVRRSQLPPPEPNEFYHDDLIGLEAVTTNGETLGRVGAVLNFGAGDILEVVSTDLRETRLLPFTREIALEIDFVGCRVVIRLPNEIDGEDRTNARPTYDP